MENELVKRLAWSGILAGVGAVASIAAHRIAAMIYVRAFGEVAVGETEVDLVLETTGRSHIRQIHKALSEEGFRIKALG